MHSIAKSTTALALLGGLALVGTLAGCSASSVAAPESTAPAAAATAKGNYKDGTYTQTASYQAPSGTEKVDVTITLAGNVITAVTVVGHATDPEAKTYQKEFAAGVGAVAVGKKIADIKVDKVGGSSLTSGGFNTAVEAIRAGAVS